MSDHPGRPLHVEARIQHHPSRANLIPALVKSLGDLPVAVVKNDTDPPSPWAGYQECMADLPDCSHMLIVQDDTIVARNFAPAVRQIAAAKPDEPVCLYLSYLPRDVSVQATKAMHQNRRFVRVNLRSFLPIVAVLWPREKLEAFRAWAQANPGLPGVGRHAPVRSDDAMGGRWKMIERQTVWACVPSIVEHPDTEPSTIGRKQMWGRDRGRSAHLFTEDALAYDWAAGT